MFVHNKAIESKRGREGGRERERKKQERKFRRFQSAVSLIIKCAQARAITVNVAEGKYQPFADAIVFSNS